ncbi:Uncharacterized protein FWK35_00029278 [Aphis craccivora]|uniref:Uncharacterized protein n=1 Tax=Aphis craccivora TaxID=307492 RepID=A0A6G0W3R1_APHCR|nr:Uncharacterized protein FWK35_00029278 [Aphis craccivora]
MSSPDSKEWFQEFATALVIDRNSDENQLIHIAEIKNEEVVESESEIEKMAVARAALILNQYGPPLSSFTKVKILLLTYFVDRESYEQLFNHAVFLDNQIDTVQFRVYNEFTVRLLITQQHNEIWATILYEVRAVCRTFIFDENHIPNILLPKHISSFHYQLGNCFHPVMDKLLNGKYPRHRVPARSRPVT